MMLTERSFMTQLLSPSPHEVVSLLTALQHDFILSKSCPHIESTTEKNLSKEIVKQDNTLPCAVKLAFKSNEEQSLLRLSLTPCMQDAVIYHTTAQHIIVENLLAGATYYWQVNDSEIRSFTTEDNYPRFLHVDGLSNVRDNGARISENGKRLIQGSLFRGSEMNLHHNITGNGKQVMLETMKIKTVLDLRAEGVEHGCPLGSAVDWVVIPITAYESFVTNCKRECKAIFDLLADASRYPIYYHCWGGADRTGTVAAFIAVVLGLSEADILLDYEITSLSIWGDRRRTSELWRSFESALLNYDGRSFSERALSFLHSCGISEQQMDNIRAILLESR